jgi:hypothetical protein
MRPDRLVSAAATSMRILHLADPETSDGSGCTLRMLADVVGGVEATHDVLIVGGRAETVAARRSGLRPIGHVCPPRAVPLAGIGTLRSLIDRRERVSGRYDLVHAWTPRATVLAAGAARDRRLLITAVPPSGRSTRRLLRSLLRRSSVTVVALSTPAAEQWIDLGRRPKDVLTLTPGVDPRCNGGDRRSRRERWGVDDHTFVVAMPGDPAGSADALSAVAVILRFAVTGRPGRIVIHPGAANRARALEWAREAGCRSLLVLDEDVSRPWTMLDGADAVLRMGHTMNGCAAPWAGPLLWGMARARPTVAESDGASAAVIDHERTGVLVDRADINAVCAWLVRLHDSPAEAGRLGAAGRERVCRDFDVSTSCDELAAIYS